MASLLYPRIHTVGGYGIPAVAIANSCISVTNGYDRNAVASYDFFKAPKPQLLQPLSHCLAECFASRFGLSAEALLYLDRCAYKLKLHACFVPLRNLLHSLTSPCVGCLLYTTPRPRDS